MQNSAPWHLWVVGILALIWNGFGAFDFAATVTRFEPYMASFPPEMLEVWYSYPWWMFVIWGVGTWGAFIGSVLLLLRKKLAVALFAASLVGVFLSTLVGIIDPPPPEMQSWGFTIVIIATTVGFFGYSFWMQKKSVLA